mmetsp:Transcript_8350/g.18283  ORF Transcript_8350/g.18283 Transcript_8350/m.18283 type:complete len:122 (-) Transcript_8350:1476-1841(-)
MLSCSRKLDLSVRKFSILNHCSTKQETNQSKIKALFIGINYTGQKYALKGCVNDVFNISDTLKLKGVDIPSENLKILVDSSEHGEFEQPTRENILKAIEWFVTDIEPGDSLLFYFVSWCAA